MGESFTRPRDAERLKASEIEHWLDQVQEDRELANATINKLRGTFSMIYKYGKRKDKIAVNPAADVHIKDVGNGIERFLSDDEEKRLRKVLQEEIDAHDSEKHPELRKQAIHRLLELEVSLKSGMRRSEQYNLRWSDVDFRRKVMRLRKTKNGKPRNAYIVADVERALRQLKELDLNRRDRSAEKPNQSPSDTVFANEVGQHGTQPGPRCDAGPELQIARPSRSQREGRRLDFCPSHP